jgi:hypothetical protein
MSYAPIYKIAQGQFEYNGCIQKIVTKLLFLPHVYLVTNILCHLHHKPKMKKRRLVKSQQHTTFF